MLSGVNEKVHKVLEKSGFYELLGEENICPNINVALERAKMIINTNPGMARKKETIARRLLSYIVYMCGLPCL